eukprot:GHUV01045416.1.p2 GENE.GHUV01045416.1~~GHUV01045416.1.p2  ORF type:complete len:124 (-),score=20.41 GHUV01045416.1:13-384(-)
MCCSTVPTAAVLTSVSLRIGCRYQQPCRCGRCGRNFDSKSKYLDLTLTSGIQQQVYKQKMWQGTELFRYRGRLLQKMCAFRTGVDGGSLQCRYGSTWFMFTVEVAVVRSIMHAASFPLLASAV